MNPCGDNLRVWAWVSIAAACLTIALKTWAWRISGSVGLLSDALESLVNLAGAIMTLWAITLAAKPAAANHAYGHSKVEYFASGFEGLLILLAALGIFWAAIQRFLHPAALMAVNAGLAASGLAALLNFIVARRLLREGQKHHAIALEADGAHLMTDVWTSLGVIVGVAAAAISGWLWLDPLLALCVAIHILWTGGRLLCRSVGGLMDSALPREEQAQIETILKAWQKQGIEFHALRTRDAASRVFISLHVLTPGTWSVQHGHDLAERIEADIRRAIPRAHVITHLEPIEDPVSQEDQTLDRLAP